MATAQSIMMRPTTTLPAVEAERRARLEKIARKAASINRERDFEIARAFLAGASLREIGEAVGMSHTGIRKIIDRTKIIGINALTGQTSIPLRDAMKLDLFEFEIVDEDE